MDSVPFFQKQVTFIKPNTQFIKTNLSSEPDQPTQGYSSKDGKSPLIYSDIIPYNIFSYLHLGTLQDPSKGKSPYLLKAPPPTYLPNHDFTNAIATRIDDIYKIWKPRDDGLIRKNKLMRGIFGEMITKLAKSIFTSNMVGVSFPVKFNENRSFTDRDRLADQFRIAHIYLAKAAKMSDKIERMKLFAVNVMGSLIAQLRGQKSFNPLLGETFQSGFADGTEIFVEQTSHHPPITHFLTIGPND